MDFGCCFSMSRFSFRKLTLFHYLISKVFRFAFFGLFEFFARAYFLQILAKFKKLAKIISVNLNPLPKTYLYTLFYQQEET